MAYKVGGLPAASTLLGSPLINNTSGAAYEKNVSGPDCIFFEDDLFYFSSSVNAPYPWAFQTNGTAANAQTSPSTAAHPGIRTLNTGTDTTGEAMMVHGSSSESTDGNIILGGGYHEVFFVLNLSTLSTAGEEYALYFGLTSGLEAFLTHPGSYGCFFQYKRGTSTNWQGLTKNAGSSTTASSGSNVAVATGWNNFKITINAAATSVSFYVNGTLIGTSAANIPTAAAHPISLGVAIQKSAGTTARTVDIDYVSWFNQLTTSRF